LTIANSSNCLFLVSFRFSFVLPLSLYLKCFFPKMLVNLLSHIERFINDSIFYIVFKEHS
jgi:hypothetical protein